jgi:CMP-N-acetylneuraminic acid synthetase
VVRQRQVLAVIPARGGSKGIPLKNRQLIGDTTLVQRVVSVCKSVDGLSHIAVSSDDSAILREVESFDVRMVHRPSELAGDDSTSESAVLHALDAIEDEDGIRFDAVLLIQATSPFTTSADVQNVLFKLTNHDSVFTAYRSHEFMWEINRDLLRGVNHDHRQRPMRQNLSDCFVVENGAVYGMSLPGFRLHKFRFFGRMGVVEMPKIRSIEIDDWDDLEFARAVDSHLRSKK